MAKRFRPGKAVAAVLGRTRKSPFGWALPAGGTWEPLHRCLQSLHTTVRKSKSGVEQVDLESMQGAIESCPGKVTAIARPLLHMTAEAYGVAVPSWLRVVSDDEPARRELVDQWQEVERPLWQDVQAGSSRRFPGRLRHLQTRLDDLLDTDGWPAASLWPDFALLAASWTRCLRLITFQGQSISDEIAGQLQWVAWQLARSSRADGSLVLGERGGGLNRNAFRKALMRMVADPDLAVAFDACQRGRLAKDSPVTAVDESSLSEWAQVGVLRSGWYRGSPTVGFTYHDGRLALEIGNRHTLVTGDTTPQLRVRGQRVAQQDDAAVTCHLTDEYVDYVELQLQFEQALLHRQMLLLRTDALLIVSDNVVRTTPATLEYECSFPLGKCVDVVPESETHERYLRRNSQFSLVIPLFLPEWKSAPSTVIVQDLPDRLTVRKSIREPGCWLPLVFDLDPKRSVKPRTWRQLTVAEKRQAVGPDVAAAFRLQIGRQQWLMYRAVTARGNRTFLGQNFADEFFVGSISSDGAVRSLLEVQ